MPQPRSARARVAAGQQEPHGPGPEEEQKLERGHGPERGLGPDAPPGPGPESPFGDLDAELERLLEEENLEVQSPSPARDSQGAHSASGRNAVSGQTLDSAGPSGEPPPESSRLPNGGADDAAGPPDGDECVGRSDSESSGWSPCTPSASGWSPRVPAPPSHTTVVAAKSRPPAPPAGSGAAHLPMRITVTATATSVVAPGQTRILDHLHAEATVSHGR